MIAVDVETEAVIGLVDAAIWTRSGLSARAQRRSRLSEEKESVRWLRGCQAAARSLSEACSVTMVADRDSDIYSLFARKPDGLHLIVRAAQDRSLAEAGRLFDALIEARLLSVNPVRVAPRGPGDKGRIAKVELRAGTVQIARPSNGLVEDLPKTLELTLLEAREVDAPPGKTPLLWRLLTTHPVTNAAQADEVVQLYRLRWRIEQTFRALKTDGLALEDSQVIDAERMFNLAAVGLAAAVRTIQLVDARDGSPRPASDVVEDAFAPPSSVSLQNSKATQRARKTLTRQARSPSSPGSQDVWADGTATISRQGLRPCATVGTSSPPHSRVMHWLCMTQIRESPSPAGAEREYASPRKCGQSEKILPRLAAHGEAAMSIDFLVTSLIIVVSPGTGVLFTLAAGLSRGARASVVAAFGCTLGIVPHMAAAILGLAALLHTSAVAFQTLKVLGVAYLLFMAWSALREKRRAEGSRPDASPRSARQVIVFGDPRQHPQSQAVDLLRRLPAAVRQRRRSQHPLETHGRAERPSSCC